MALTGRLESAAAGETLCGDGAWGTELMARGIRPGNCLEALSLSRPDLLAEIAAAYIDAGAELVTTNSFGASPTALARHGLADRTEELNRAAVNAVKGVADGRALVSGSVGPTGIMLAPLGDGDPAEISAGFETQIAGLVAAGADVVCVETMMDLEEARLAVAAARVVSGDIPVIATMTFDPTPRGFFTTMGVSVAEACNGLVDAGADLIGANCGHGIEVMIELARELDNHTRAPLVIQANAGLPETSHGELEYPETPEFVAARVPALLELGVAVIGGCCGTGPGHIRAVRTVIDEWRVGRR
jgi:5-methyltetrahydrofolate--homocysteine methyltransferase